MLLNSSVIFIYWSVFEYLFLDWGVIELLINSLRPSATCVRKKIIIGSDSGLSPSRRQALIWTNAWNIVNSTPRNKLQWNINRNSCIFIPNRRHEQAVMKLWHVKNIIGMSIHKELLIAICTMHYVAISIRVCEISLWRPLRHATGGSKGCWSGLSDTQTSVPPVSPGLSRRRPMCHRVEVETDILNYLCMLKWAITAQVVSCNWLVYTDLPFWA